MDFDLEWVNLSLVTNRPLEKRASGTVQGRKAMLQIAALFLVLAPSVAAPRAEQGQSALAPITIHISGMT